MHILDVDCKKQFREIENKLNVTYDKLERERWKHTTDLAGSPDLQDQK